MAETPTTMSSDPPTPPSSAAEQARLRKERREAKIRAGGSARLNKITGLGGGIPRDPPPQPSAATSSATAAPAQAEATAHADPDEVDISQHYYEPSGSARSRGRINPNAPFPSAGQQPALDEAALRQMMLGFDTPTPTPPGQGAPGGAFGGMPSAPGAGAQEDPMMAMLQQMLGGAGAGAGGMPPGMAGPGGAGMPSFPGMMQPPVAAEPYAYVWRVVHAVFALGLGLYIAMATTFRGTKAERDVSGLGTSYLTGEAGMSVASVHFFWIFATAEMVLQTSRFFIEKGRVQQGAIMNMITGFLPEPYKGYVALVSRYSTIWTTVTADALALVFVLGACAWWRSA